MKKLLSAFATILLVSAVSHAATIYHPRPVPTPPPIPNLAGTLILMQVPMTPVALMYHQYCVPTAFSVNGVDGVCNYYYGTNPASSIDSYTAHWDAMSGNGQLLSLCGHTVITGSGTSYNSCPAAKLSASQVNTNGLVLNVSATLNSDYLLYKIVNPGGGLPPASMIYVWIP
jgi:hypothetical protein